MSPTQSITDRTAVIEQLNRILTSPLFRNSKRCGPLLQYIVLETIEGRGDAVKERAIGISVFHRKPTYDTNEDPIVRSSAAEVRKRIAQYYHEQGHESELRIDLTSGSYVPHFYAPPPSPAVDLRVTGTRRRVPVLRIAAAGVTLLAVAGIVWALVADHGSRSASKAFWAPLENAESVILATGDVSEVPASGAAQPTFAQTSQGDTVGFADGFTMARVSALLGAAGRKLEIRRARSLTLADLRRAPAVLIGEMDNPWTRLLEGNMRFQFNWDIANGIVSLQDQSNPGKPLWSLSWNTPYSQLKEDRAIITRMIEPRTEHAVLVLAGCGRDGTTAAGEFVSEPRYLEALAARAPRGWSRRNLQVVIATELINGHSGPPRVIATHFW
jgi:hypothetical protein